MRLLENLVYSIQNCFLILLLSLPCIISAQECEVMFVSEITGGEVLLQSGKQKVGLKTGQQITGKDILHVSEGTTMILLDPKNSDHYTIKGSYVGDIAGYKKRNGMNCVKHISQTYFNYLYSCMLNPRDANLKRKTESGSTAALRKADDIFGNDEECDSLSIFPDSIAVLLPDSIITIPADTVR